MKFFENHIEYYSIDWFVYKNLKDFDILFEMPNVWNVVNNNE